MVTPAAQHFFKHVLILLWNWTTAALANGFIRVTLPVMLYDANNRARAHQDLACILGKLPGPIPPRLIQNVSRQQLLRCKG